jgi:hypothetical protein
MGHPKFKIKGRATRPREYGVQGRWPSPDPLGMGAVDLSDPQSWNRYAYVGNNPLIVRDPTGEGGELSLCAISPITCILGVIGQIFELFGLFGHHVTPHAAPAPPGGYGAGIDAFGTYGSSSPAGVQTLPHIFIGIGVGGSIGSLPVPVPTFPSDPISDTTATLNSVFKPIDPTIFMSDNPLNQGLVLAGAVQYLIPLGRGIGIGPTFPFAEGNGFTCGGYGLAIGSIGHAINWGFVAGSPNVQQVLSGQSYSWNVQANPLVGLQSIWNSSGELGGNTFGTPGSSISDSNSACHNFF